MQLNIVLYGDSITEDLASMGSVLDLYRQDYRMDAFGISGTADYPDIYFFPDIH